MHKHHRKRRSQGGDDSPANIMHVTPEFHDWIHSNVSESYELGFLVESFDKPEFVSLPEPSMSAGIGHWLLVEDGWRESASVPGGASETDAEGSGHSETGKAQGSRSSQPCPRCHGTGALQEPPTKAEKPRQRKTLGIRLPVDADENGIEVLEALLTVARDELREQMGWKDSVPAYYVLVAVLHGWITSRAGLSGETA